MVLTSLAWFFCSTEWSSTSCPTKLLDYRRIKLSRDPHHRNELETLNLDAGYKPGGPNAIPSWNGVDTSRGHPVSKCHREADDSIISIFVAILVVSFSV